MDFSGFSRALCQASWTIWFQNVESISNLLVFYFTTMDAIDSHLL